MIYININIYNILKLLGSSPVAVIFNSIIHIYMIGAEKKPCIYTCNIYAYRIYNILWIYYRNGYEYDQ